MKWEYLNLWYVGRPGSNLDAVKVVQNEKVIFEDSKKSANIFDFINKLGEAGWEMVSVTRDGLAFDVFFKRPLAEK